MRLFSLFLVSALLLASSASANLYSARQVVVNNANVELPGGVDDLVNADDGVPAIAPPMLHFDNQWGLTFPCPYGGLSYPCAAEGGSEGVEGTFWSIGTKDVVPNVAWTTAAQYNRWTILYGGFETENDVVSSNFMFFDRQSRTWWDRTLEAPNNPGPLFHHCSVVEGHTLYLMGGCIDRTCTTTNAASANHAIHWINLRNLTEGWNTHSMNFIDADGISTRYTGPHPLAGRMGFSCFVADSDIGGIYDSEGGVAFIGGVTNAALADPDYQPTIVDAWFLDLPRVVSDSLSGVNGPWADSSDSVMYANSGFSAYQDALGNLFDNDIEYWVTNLVAYDSNMNNFDVSPGFLLWGGYMCVNGGLVLSDSTFCVQGPSNDVAHFLWDEDADPPNAWVIDFYLSERNNDFDAYLRGGSLFWEDQYPMAREGESVWEYDGAVFRAQGGIGDIIANKTILNEEYAGPLLTPAAISNDLRWNYDPHCQLDYFHFCSETGVNGAGDCSDDGFANSNLYFNFWGRIEDQVDLYDADELWVRWPVGHIDGYRADI